VSREVQIVRWCDGRDHEGPTRATVERTVSVDGGRIILLDLCEPCDKLVQEVLALMESGIEAAKVMDPTPPPRGNRKGRPPGIPTSEKEDAARAARRQQIHDEGQDRTDCLEPGCGYEGPTRSALGQHINSSHPGKKLSDYNWRRT